MAGHVWEAGGRGQEGARENCGWPTGPDRGGGGFNGGGIRLRVSNHSILYLLGVLYDFSAADMPFVPLKGKITQFQEDFCRKGTQRTHRQELMLFFLCDLCVLLRPVQFGCGFAALDFLRPFAAIPPRRHWKERDLNRSAQRQQRVQRRSAERRRMNFNRRPRRK